MTRITVKVVKENQLYEVSIHDGANCTDFSICKSAHHALTALLEALLQADSFDLYYQGFDSPFLPDVARNQL